MINTSKLLDLDHSIAKDYFLGFEMPWQILTSLKEVILNLQQKLDKEEFDEVSHQVFIHKSVKIAPNAYIGGPAIIGKNTEIRQSAFIRGVALIGENCVIGNSTEIKNSVLFDNVEVPHFNYVGDSILGYSSHMGAGAICSNVKSDKSNVVVHDGEVEILTKLEKFGCILGDHSEVGCNSVLNPGTIIGRNSIIYPLSSVRGVIPSDVIFKNDGLVKRV